MREDQLDEQRVRGLPKRERKDNVDESETEKMGQDE